MAGAMDRCVRCGVLAGRCVCPPGDALPDGEFPPEVRKYLTAFLRALFLRRFRSPHEGWIHMMRVGYAGEERDTPNGRIVVPIDVPAEKLYPLVVTDAAAWAATGHFPMLPDEVHPNPSPPHATSSRP